MTDKAHDGLEVVAYLAWRDGKPCWEGDDCVCEDAVYPADYDDDRTSEPLVRLSSAQAAVEAARETYKALYEGTMRQAMEIAGWKADQKENLRIQVEQHQRITALEAALGVAREAIGELRYSSSTFESDKLSSEAIALIDKTMGGA